MSSSASLDNLNRTSFPSSLPTPISESPPSFPPDPVPRKNNSALLLLARSDKFTARLLKVLATPGGTDRVLATVNYTLVLLSASLTSLLETRLRSITTALAADASSILLPGEKLVATIQPSRALARLARLATSSKTLANTISDHRVFVRLWGLLNMYAWGKSVYLSPSPDAGLRAIAYTQVAVNTVFQFLENRAYLAGKGVITRPAASQTRDWIWSSRCWALHTSLEFVRLWRQRTLWAREDKVAATTVGGSEKAVGEGAWWNSDPEGAKAKAKRREDERLWKKDLLVNAAYFPMTLHWSREEPLLSQVMVGVLGLVAGATGLREVWRSTA